MKRMVIWLFVLWLAAMNWAALHDILKGEQNVRLEWSFVAGSATQLAVHLIRRFTHSA